jgi:hypothetical protein
MGRASISIFWSRVSIFVSLCAVIPVGLGFKFYDGPGAWWFNNYGAGVAYEIFWCLVVFLIWPKKRNATKIVVGVFVVTYLLEALQLWHPTFLEKVRATFLGAALIGTTFTWWDFPHYALGSSIGWLWMRGLGRIVTMDNINKK